MWELSRPWTHVPPVRERRLDHRSDVTIFRVLFPDQVIRADDLGPAMVDVTVHETEESHSLYVTLVMSLSPAS